MKMYKIFADYRPKDSVKPHWYYVWAKNKTEAKKRFNEKISWLKIYEIEECDEALTKEVKENPRMYILF